MVKYRLFSSFFIKIRKQLSQFAFTHEYNDILAFFYSRYAIFKIYCLELIRRWVKYKLKLPKGYSKICNSSIQLFNSHEFTKQKKSRLQTKKEGNLSTHMTKKETTSSLNRQNNNTTQKTKDCVTQLHQKWGCSQVLLKGKQILLHKWHPSCCQDIIQ